MNEHDFIFQNAYLGKVHMREKSGKLFLDENDADRIMKVLREYKYPLRRKTYSATEIGEMVGLPPITVGKIANQYHLKTDRYGKYITIQPAQYPAFTVFRYYINVIPTLNKIINVL